MKRRVSRGKQVCKSLRDNHGPQNEIYHAGPRRRLYPFKTTVYIRHSIQLSRIVRSDRGIFRVYRKSGKKRTPPPITAAVRESLGGKTYTFRLLAPESERTGRGLRTIIACKTTGPETKSINKKSAHCRGFRAVVQHVRPIYFAACARSFGSRSASNKNAHVLFLVFAVLRVASAIFERDSNDPS